MTNSTAPPPTRVPDPQRMEGDWVTLLEMVDIFKVKRVTVDQWYQRRRQAADPARALPDPDDFVGDKPVWRLPRILIWGRLTGKDTFEDDWRAKRDAGAYRTRLPRKASTPTATGSRPASSRTRKEE